MLPLIGKPHRPAELRTIQGKRVLLCFLGRSTIVLGIVYRETRAHESNTKRVLGRRRVCGCGRPTPMNRRGFLKNAACLPAVAGLGLGTSSPGSGAEPRFRIGLAEWSLHVAIQSRLITNLDFPRVAREHFGIEGLEFVNTLWEPPTQDYLRRLKAAVQKTGTRPLLLMCDGEGQLGHSEKATRLKAAQNHHKWVDAAAELGCHSIRVNLNSDVRVSSPADIDALTSNGAEAIVSLCEYAAKAGINVTVENHGGISTNPDVIVSLVKKVKRPDFGTLVDLGNFPDNIDRYEAAAKLLSYAKAVDFKCKDFGPDGEETRINSAKMMQILLASPYRGYLAIEYDGTRLPEFEGIARGKRVLDKIL